MIIVIHWEEEADSWKSSAQYLDRISPPCSIIIQSSIKIIIIIN
jgi:hypothetical protein